MAEVLNARRHVLIEGGPGTGKSTFTHHVSGTLASVRLGDEAAAAAADLTGVSAVAVRVPAGHLADDAPLTSLLHASVRTRLGIRLTHELPADLFAAPPHGVPWLLLVDGLDEILDPVARERVITTIARDAANPSSPYRWVVTTRPLLGRRTGSLAERGTGSMHARRVRRRTAPDTCRGVAGRSFRRRVRPGPGGRVPAATRRERTPPARQGPVAGHHHPDHLPPTQQARPAHRATGTVPGVHRVPAHRPRRRGRAP